MALAIHKGNMFPHSFAAAFVLFLIVTVVVVVSAKEVEGTCSDGDRSAEKAVYILHPRNGTEVEQGEHGVWISLQVS